MFSEEEEEEEEEEKQLNCFVPQFER